ncbi:MAG: leucine-rich repeat domain-containing protein, partial [Muribaculaceae bacterium]|nr:leucine-rich repeat domain-containing protein [Muribaculaceae bacterium]
DAVFLGKCRAGGINIINASQSDDLILQNISGAHGVTKISEKAFYGCTEIKGINIPKSIKTICERSFYGCIGLTKIEIPEGITTIEKRVFYGCYNLKSIVLPDSITEIGEKAFYGCMALEKICVSKGKMDYFKRLLPTELHDKIVEI